ncbi:unnamed protein product [Urochloa humidicola]
MVEKDFVLHLPIGKKRGLGRARKNRIPSCTERSGKATRQTLCDNCGEVGHRKGSWRCPLTGTKKRKRSKKTKAKAGRKKAKKDNNSEAGPSEAGSSEPVEIRTPRTRAAAAREAAAAAEREAAAAEAQAQAHISSSAKRRLELEVPLALEAPPAGNTLGDLAPPSIQEYDSKEEAIGHQNIQEGVSKEEKCI